MMRHFARILGWLLAALIICLSALPAQAAPAPAPIRAPAAGHRPTPRATTVTGGSAAHAGYMYIVLGQSVTPKHTITICVPAGCWSVSTNGDTTMYGKTYYTGLWGNQGDWISMNLVNDNQHGYQGTACSAWPPGPGNSPTITTANLQSVVFGRVWEDYTDMDCNDVYVAVDYAPLPTGWHDRCPRHCPAQTPHCARRQRVKRKKANSHSRGRSFQMCDLTHIFVTTARDSFQIDAAKNCFRRTSGKVAHICSLVFTRSSDVAMTRGKE